MPIDYNYVTNFRRGTWSLVDGTHTCSSCRRAALASFGQLSWDQRKIARTRARRSPCTSRGPPKASMTARSPIRYAHNGDAAIAYMESGSGIDLLVIGGSVSRLEIVPSLPAAQRFWDRMGSSARDLVRQARDGALRPGRWRVHAGERGGRRPGCPRCTGCPPVGDLRHLRRRIGGDDAGCRTPRPRECDGPVRHLCPSRPSRRSPRASRRQAQGILESSLGRLGRSVHHRLRAPSRAGDPELHDWWGRLLRSGLSPRGARALFEM